MGHIKMVFRFGWPYLKRYWLRLAFGVAIGMLFGATNASFVWATKTLMERLETPGGTNTVAIASTNTQATAANSTTPASPKLKEDQSSTEFKNRAGRAVNRAL